MKRNKRALGPVSSQNKGRGHVQCPARGAPDPVDWLLAPELMQAILCSLKEFYS